MAKEKSPAFQFYAKDFLADINVAMMTMEERGQYITLLAYCWIERGLPSDSEALANLCGGIPPSDRVMACFDSGPHGLTHKRLKKELEKQKSFKKKMSESGIKGAEKRWGKRVRGGSLPYSQANARPMASDSSASSSASTLKKPKKRTGPSEKAIKLGEAYRDIRPDGVAAGLTNIDTWLNEGESYENMLQAISNYRPQALQSDPKYRKKLGNFFGRKEPEWKDWVNKPKAAIQEDPENRRIRIENQKRLARQKAYEEEMGKGKRNVS